MPVAYATYHGREGFGFGESHMTWQPGAPLSPAKRKLLAKRIRGER